MQTKPPVYSADIAGAAFSGERVPDKPSSTEIATAVRVWNFSKGAMVGLEKAVHLCLLFNFDS